MKTMTAAGIGSLMSKHADSGRPVVVVGAGIAGLICAADLHAAGRPVLILEATDAIGGRVSSERTADGFLLDRGFQVLLDAYPVLQRHISLDALRPRAFDAGALIWTGSRLELLVDPIRNPSESLSSFRSSVMTWGDRWRLARFGMEVKRADWLTAAEAAAGSSGSALDYLEHYGFSSKFIEHFAQPFWGGVTLDHGLSGSVGPLKFTTRMFLQGSAVLPTGGMAALPRLLAHRLPANQIRTAMPVDEIAVVDSRAEGVFIRGELFPASAVVVATDARSAAALTGIPAIPTTGHGCITVYLAGQRDPGTGKRLVLNGTHSQGGVNHIAPLSAVADDYAPAGQHLLAAVLLDHPKPAAMGDAAVADLARAAVAEMLGHKPEDWRALATIRVPFSQFAQPPGIYETLPSNETATPGLFLAGEYTVDASLNGAALSGEEAAKRVMRYLQEAGNKE